MTDTVTTLVNGGIYQFNDGSYYYATASLLDPEQYYLFEIAIPDANDLSSWTTAHRVRKDNGQKVVLGFTARHNGEAITVEQCAWPFNEHYWIDGDVNKDKTVLASFTLHSFAARLVGVDEVKPADITPERVQNANAFAAGLAERKRRQ